MDEDQRDPKIKEREERAREAAGSIGLMLMDVKGWAGWFWLADPETGIAVAGGPLVKDALTIEEVEKEIRGRGENGESGEGKRGRGVGGPSVVRWASRTGRWTHSFPSRRDRRDRAPTSARCCCSGPRSAGCRCPRRRSPHWMGTWDGVGQCECMDPQYICAEEPAVLVSSS